MNEERNGHRKAGVSVADREQWVRRYREGDLGLKSFAERHGLRPAQLHYWVYGARRPTGTLQAAAPAAAPPLMFREVRLPRHPSAEWGAQITWPDGLGVGVARDADPAWVAAVIQHLRRACSR